MNPAVKICSIGFIAVFVTGLLHPLYAADVLVTKSVKGKVSTLVEPPAARGEGVKASLILLVGGNGVLKLSKSGEFSKKQTNFLARVRSQFHSNGFVTALPDAPLAKQSKKGLKGFRTKGGHAKDLAKIARKLKKRNTRPVIVVGTSRGTISAANLAAHVGAGLIDAVVLTSTVSKGKDHLSIKGVAVEQIKVPVLIVHHKQDACPKTPFNLARKLAGKLKSAGVKTTFKAITGGRTKGKAKRCKGASYHGFLGVEENVVALISMWIDRVIGAN